MGMKPRARSEVNQAFDIIKFGDTTVKIVLERPASSPKIDRMRIVGGGVTNDRGSDGVTTLRLNILFSEKT